MTDLRRAAQAALLPCPFCGSTDIRTYTYHDDPERTCRQCHYCGAMGPDDCEGLNWNTRHALAQADEPRVQREALRRLWPLIEKGTRGFVFTADRAGEVTADMNTLREWIAAAPQPTAQMEQWIACSERMPPLGEEVLVYLAEAPCESGNRVAFDCWDEQHEAPVSFSSATIPVGKGWDSGTDWAGITHWQPLPEPPKPAQEDA